MMQLECSKFKLKAPLTGTFTARQGSASPGRPAQRPGLLSLPVPLAWQSRWDSEDRDLQWRTGRLPVAALRLPLALAVPVPLRLTVTVPLHYLIAA